MGVLRGDNPPKTPSTDNPRSSARRIFFRSLLLLCQAALAAAFIGRGRVAIMGLSPIARRANFKPWLHTGALISKCRRPKCEMGLGNDFRAGGVAFHNVNFLKLTQNPAAVRASRARVLSLWRRVGVRGMSFSCRSTSGVNRSENLWTAGQEDHHARPTRRASRWTTSPLGDFVPLRCQRSTVETWVPNRLATMIRLIGSSDSRSKLISHTIKKDGGRLPK